MSNSNEEARPLDDERINVENATDLSHWSHVLRVDERTLRAAVQQVGASVKAVRFYLSTSKTQP